MSKPGISFLIGLLLLLISVSAGTLLGEFWIAVATEALIMTLFAMSFSLLYGQTGLLSFGQAAYFGVGAYGFALSYARFDLPFPLCLVIGIAAGTLWAWITGYVCVRLAGIYFAIITVVVSQSTFYVLFQWYGFTGGDDGIQGLLPPSILVNPRVYYYFTLAIISVAFLCYYQLLSSPFGLSLRCIRENTLRSQFVGIDVQRHRLRAFVFAGTFASLAGVLYAPFNRTVVPQMANWLSSGNAVFMGILGGASQFFGPIVGAIVWVFLDALITGFTEHWPLIIGSIILTIVLFMPAGLSGIRASYIIPIERDE
jgi:branched-chain amino acid transport system permease protein